MELSEAIEILKQLRDIYVQPAECGLSTGREVIAVDTLLQVLGNSISKDKIQTYIKERLDSINKLLEDMIDKSTGCINVSCLTKREKEEVINKCNCLLVQKATLQQVKEELLKGE